ncbi:hypothetical protein INT46_002432 [Mucor plumbeus]|uniref:BHLH domain-containing protein n=1 Tax=Mucor plumbeus TaxID=97098 RepID=A0A8H7QHK1_9FUNG|nr:hypothetical protein INT46_002432 [Mucor plumbeus]
MSDKDGNYKHNDNNSSKSYRLKPSPLSSSPTRSKRCKSTEVPSHSYPYPSSSSSGSMNVPSSSSYYSTQVPPPPLPLPLYPASSYSTGTEYYHASPTSPSSTYNFPPPPPPPIDLAWDQQYNKAQTSKRKSPDTHPYHYPQHNIKHESSTDIPTPAKERRHRKQPHELLSESQKKANHIASEQKRRQNIRIGFDQLIDIVPSLNHGNRSEALILQKSIDHIRYLISMKNELKNQVRDLQGTLGETNYEEDVRLYIFIYKLYLA